jgi:maltose-binding protein MalE
VTTLPIVSATGRPATPFAGAEALMMSSRTHDKDAAFAVMDYLTSDEAAVIRAKQARQVVPNRHAYDDPEVAADQTLATFRAQLTHSVPMPNEAAMRMVWDPYQTALGEVLTGRVEPGPALLKVDRELTTYLKRSP